MNILVPVKRVVDYSVNIRIKPDGSGVETANVKMSMNPFDEIAVEEALRIKERGEAAEVIVISIGDAKAAETLRTALAMGADRAILVQTDQPLLPLDLARVLKQFAAQENCDLVLLGKQSIDGDNNQTGQMLAALADRSHALFASKITKQDNGWTVERETDRGTEVVQLTGQAVITTDLRLNEPRFIKLPNIMQAKKKPLQIIALDELTVIEGLDTAADAALQQLSVAAPASRTAGEMVADVDTLLDKLRTQKGLLL